jgi:hypothetical protein
MSHGDAGKLAHGMKEKAAEFQHSGSRNLFQTLMGIGTEGNGVQQNRS